MQSSGSIGKQGGGNGCFVQGRVTVTSFGEGVEQGGVTFCNHVAEIFTHTLSWCQADVIQREGFTAVPPLLDLVGILGGIFCCDDAWRSTKNHGVFFMVCLLAPMDQGRLRRSQCVCL